MKNLAQKKLRVQFTYCYRLWLIIQIVLVKHTKREKCQGMKKTHSTPLI